MSLPDWLFLVCPARSGSTLLFSLLDGHPEILVWPFELRYFQEFFVKHSNDAPTASASMLAEQFMPTVLRFHEEKFSTYYSSIDVSGTVDAALFEKGVAGIKDRQVTAEEFLSEIYGLYAQSLICAPSAPRYNLVKTMAKGFDWRNKDLIERSKFIYMVRPVGKRYASQRNKFIEKFNCGPVETFERCIRLYFENKLAWEVYDRFRDHPNFMFIDLTRMQSAPGEVMSEVADFLGVEHAPSLSDPTFLGKPFEGHFHDKSLNTGKIIRTESRHTPLLSFEEQLLTTFENNELPLLENLIKPYGSSVFEELDSIFPGVTENDRRQVAEILLRFYTETERLAGTALTDQGYTQWKKAFPTIQ